MIDIFDEDKRTLLKERRMKIGKRIAEERGKKGLTQMKLAEKLSAMLGDGDIAQTTISSWERGNSLPSLGRLLAMAQIFECDCGYLLCDYEQKTHNALEICKETGLSEASVESLCFLNKWGDTEEAHVIDFLLFDNARRYPGHNFRGILDLLHFFLKYDDEQAVKKAVSINGAFRDIPSGSIGVSIDSIQIDQRIIENAVLNEIQQALISVKRKLLENRKAANNGKH